MKHACDMRGMLSFHILWHLARQPMHGEQLAEEIGRKRGEKPKAGTIYPALKELSKKGLIRGEKKGKTIVYSLTPDGRKAVNSAREYFCRAFEEIFEGYKKDKSKKKYDFFFGNSRLNKVRSESLKALLSPKKNP